MVLWNWKLAEGSHEMQYCEMRFCTGNDAWHDAWNANGYAAPILANGNGTAAIQTEIWLSVGFCQCFAVKVSGLIADLREI